MSSPTGCVPFMRVSVPGIEAPPTAGANGHFAMLGRRLALHSRLNAGDRAALAGLQAERRRLEPYGYLIRAGQPTTLCAVLLTGFAFRQKTAGDGGRQIVALHVPGDALDLQNLHLGIADHSVQALTRIEIATVPKAAMQEIEKARIGLSIAMTRDMLIEASLYREWMLNLGRRDARTRIAHFLSELHIRLRRMDLAATEGLELPMSQEQLGDLVGLTPIHVNRTLRGLEEDGLIVRERRMIRIPDRAALATAGDFDPAYLHLEKAAD